MKFASTFLLATGVGAFAPSSMKSRSTALNIAVGDNLPSAEIFKDSFPDVEKVDVAAYAKGKNIIIVGLPGAFTPT